jgi:hypothetical protein
MDTQWHELTASALKKKCEERGLPKSGVKVDLLNRLREHDEKYRPQPEQDPAPLRRHSDHYRPQYDDRGQGSSPGNVPRDLSTMRQQPAGDVRIDRRQSTLTEGELEQICRDNYLPYESDRAGTGRKTEILTEYNLKAEETKKKRDAAISKVETKYKNEMAKLDKDKKEKLDQLDREIAPKLEKQRIWGPAFAQLQVRCCSLWASLLC